MHYLLHTLRARSRYRIHSPYVYGLATQALHPRASAACTAIRSLHHRLRQDATPVQLQGFGANATPRTTTVGRLARTSASHPLKGALLHRLVAYHSPLLALELGTNLGIGTAYMSSALPAGATLHSIEGEPALTVLARQHLSALGLQAQLHTGSFAQVLPTLPLQGLQLAYLDGHHTLEATLQLVDALLPLLAPEAVLILDDIYWSPGMTEAWRRLRSHPAFPLSLDLYHLGLLVRRPIAPQQLDLWVRPF